MPISTVNILQTSRYDKYCYCKYIGSRLLALYLHIYIVSWPILNVKVTVIRNTIAKTIDNTESCSISPYIDVYAVLSCWMNEVRTVGVCYF